MRDITKLSGYPRSNVKTRLFRENKCHPGKRHTVDSAHGECPRKSFEWVGGTSKFIHDNKSGERLQRNTEG